MSYFLEYNLGHRTTSGKAAEKGTMVHKVLEVLALTNMALTRGELTFHEPELDYVFDATACWPDDVLDLVWDYEMKKTKNEFTQRDKADCKKWVWKALQYRDGLYDPRKLNVKGVEVHFDFPIKKKWAEYEYELPDGQILKGHLGLKGTIDLVTEINKDTLEFVDWKTGKWQTDFATGETKDFEKLCSDPQLRIYYYALRHVYPTYKNIVPTIFFIQGDGPFSMCFSDKDLRDTEDMLAKKFERIKKTKIPKLTKSWKCTKTCYFGMNQHPGSKDTICEFMRKKVLARGMDYTLANHSQDKTFGHLMHYGEGGGRTTRLTDGQTEV